MVELDHLEIQLLAHVVWCVMSNVTPLLQMNSKVKRTTLYCLNWGRNPHLCCGIRTASFKLMGFLLFLSIT